MLVVVNYGGKLSLKARFVVQLFKASSDDIRLFYLVRKTDLHFRAKWDRDQVELATSTPGLFIYVLLMILKNPKDLRDGLMARVFNRNRSHALINEGFFSVLSKVLHQYFVVPSKTDELISFLNKVNSSKIFIIDEFVSANLVNLKMLKILGPLIYVSQDLAYNNFSFAGTFIARKLMNRFERDAVTLSDIVIACSERDRLKYLEMGAKKVLFYPNIYPIREFEPDCKEPEPSISIVLRGHWGQDVDRSLEEIFKAFSRVNKKIKVNMIGINPQTVPKNVELHHYGYLPTKMEYLKILSQSWVGINIGIHLGGTNERKYDYAMAGLVIFSDFYGCRGDLLPHEYTYVDSHDLIAKLEQILEQGRELISEMGLRNRKHALNLAEKQRKSLLSEVNKLILCES